MLRTLRLGPNNGSENLSGSDRASSGLASLDEILGGGFVKGRLHLVEGRPGTGKTTLGMQFVLAGRDQNEKVLYVSMSETRDELQAVAGAHGWSLEGVEMCELVARPLQKQHRNVDRGEMPAERAAKMVCCLG